jgi:Methyltransferase domain
MLENYARNDLGVIYQVDRKPFVYDEAYVNKAYGAAPVEAMSHLRFGHLVGAIGKVPGSLLDVGYGSGDFLKVAKKIVLDVNGYDVPPAYPIEGVNLVGDIYSRSFEVVTFFDVLEHFEDPADIAKLKTDYVHISLPWCHYFSDEWFKNWKHRKPNEHLWHFNPDSLKAFMASVGYEMLHYCNVEDTIRKGPDSHPNILSATFRKTR